MIGVESDSRCGYPLEISLGDGEPTRALGGWMSFRTGIRLTVHWIASDCDLGRSAFTHQARMCRVTYACGWMRMCVEFQDEILLRGGRM